MKFRHWMRFSSSEVINHRSQTGSWVSKSEKVGIPIQAILERGRPPELLQCSHLKVTAKNPRHITSNICDETCHGNRFIFHNGGARPIFAAVVGKNGGSFSLQPEQFRRDWDGSVCKIGRAQTHGFLTTTGRDFKIATKHILRYFEPVPGS